MTTDPSTAQRQDERDLWAAFGDAAAYRTPRGAGIALGIPNKRVEYLCHKWTKAGIYNWGVSIDMGWKEASDD